MTRAKRPRGKTAAYCRERAALDRPLSTTEKLRVELEVARREIARLHAKHQLAEQRVSDLEQELAVDRDNYLRDYVRRNEAVEELRVPERKAWWKFWA